VAFVFRKFRARVGCEPAALEHLRTAACRIVAAQPGSVVICRTDEPGEVVWLGQESTGLMPGCGDAFAACEPGVSLRFVDGWYRLPAPPYEIWNFELRTAGEPHLETLKELLELSRASEAHPRVVGRSLFRAVEDPSVFVGFLGLACRGSREAGSAGPGVAARGSVVWRPLFLVYKIEAAPGTPVRIGGGGGLTLPALWTPASRPRSLRGAPGSTAPEAPQPAGPHRGRQWAGRAADAGP